MLPCSRQVLPVPKGLTLQVQQGLVGSLLRVGQGHRGQQTVGGVTGDAVEVLGPEGSPVLPAGAAAQLGSSQVTAFHPSLPC